MSKNLFSISSADNVNIDAIQASPFLSIKAPCLHFYFRFLQSKSMSVNQAANNLERVKLIIVLIMFNKLSKALFPFVGALSDLLYFFDRMLCVSKQDTIMC